MFTIKHFFCPLENEDEVSIIYKIEQHNIREYIKWKYRTILNDKGPEGSSDILPQMYAILTPLLYRRPELYNRTNRDALFAFSSFN
jgi:hypothetical protein